MARNRTAGLQDARPAQQDARGDVRAIGITDRHHFLDRELIMVGRGQNEIRQFVRASLQILQVKDPFRQPAKESRVTVLQNLAPRTKQGRRRIELAAERDELCSFPPVPCKSSRVRSEDPGMNW